MLRHSVLSDCLRPHGLYPARLLCPWDSPGKNTGVGCHFLLQGIFPTQGLNLRLLHLLHWQANSLPLCHLGCLFKEIAWHKEEIMALRAMYPGFKSSAVRFQENYTTSQHHCNFFIQ